MRLLKALPINRVSISAVLLVLALGIGCATPGLMKRWEREEQRSVESNQFVIFLDETIPMSVGREVLSGLEFARDRVGAAFNYYSDEKIVCNLYRNEKNLRNVCVGLPLGFVVPRRAPLAYVLGGEVHGRLYTTGSGSVSRLWASTFPHEYCHVMFKATTGRHYFQYSWLQEGIGEYFRRLYLQENVLPPDFQPGDDEHFLLASEPSKDPNNLPLALRDRTRGIMSYTDWEVRDAMRYGDLVPVWEMNPRTFFGYWRKFNTTKANQIYAISSSLVEYLVQEHGWRKMRELLAGLKENSDIDEVMTEVFGYDQRGLDERWRIHLRERWPDPWQPNIAMVYLVRGNWEVDGHRAGIRTALANKDVETAELHRMYLESRSVGGRSPGPPFQVARVNHLDRLGAALPDTGPLGASYQDPEGLEEENRLVSTDSPNKKPPAVEHYDAAMAAYSIGRFAEGVKHLVRALDAEPEQIESLRIHLARGAWLTDRQEMALELYRDEMLTNKDLPFVNEVAWCHERAGDHETALTLYRLIEESTEIDELRKHARRRIDRLSVQASAGGALVATEDGGGLR